MNNSVKYKVHISNDTRKINLLITTGREANYIDSNFKLVFIKFKFPKFNLESFIKNQIPHWKDNKLTF